MWISKYIHLEFFVNLIVIATFVITFLTVFFFTYGATTEEQVVVQNVNYLIDDIMDSYVLLLTNEQKTYIKDYLKDVKLEDMSKQDEDVRKSNRLLKNNTFFILGALVIFVFLVTSTISYYKGYNYFKIIVKNLVLLAGIGLVEYLFLVFFGSRFISANTNFIKGKIAKMFYNPNATFLTFEDLKNYFKNNPDKIAELLLMIENDPNSVTNKILMQIKERPDKIDEIFEDIKNHPEKYNKEDTEKVINFMNEHNISIPVNITTPTPTNITFPTNMTLPTIRI